MASESKRNRYHLHTTVTAAPADPYQWIEVPIFSVELEALVKAQGDTKTSAHLLEQLVDVVGQRELTDDLLLKEVEVTFNSKTGKFMKSKRDNQIAEYIRGITAWEKGPEEARIPRDLWITACGVYSSILKAHHYTYDKDMAIMVRLRSLKEVLATMTSLSDLQANIVLMELSWLGKTLKSRRITTLKMLREEWGSVTEFTWNNHIAYIPDGNHDGHNDKAVVDQCRKLWRMHGLDKVIEYTKMDYKSMEWTESRTDYKEEVARLKWLSSSTEPSRETIYETRNILYMLYKYRYGGRKMINSASLTSRLKYIRDVLSAWDPNLAPVNYWLVLLNIEVMALDSILHERGEVVADEVPGPIRNDKRKRVLNDPDDGEATDTEYDPNRPPVRWQYTGGVLPSYTPDSGDDTDDYTPAPSSRNTKPRTSGQPKPSGSTSCCIIC